MESDGNNCLSRGSRIANYAAAGPEDGVPYCNLTELVLMPTLPDVSLALFNHAERQ
jgi:hypothetical protein